MRWAPIHRWVEMVSLYRQTEFSLPSFGDIVRMPWAGSPLARRHGLPFRVSRWLADREPLAGAPGWRVVASPGHTDDSICLHHGAAKALVSGDVVLGVAGKACFNPFYAFDEDEPRSERRLLKLGAQRVLPGHGLPVLEGGIDAESGLVRKKRRKNT
jgi:glyoxylase-like metal-dependent hydrolase (beta-lactamase superfamily II)